WSSDVCSSDLLHFRQRGRRLGRVKMTGADDRVAGQPGEGLQAAVDLLRVAAREVRTATPLEKQRVARHELVLDKKALAPRRVTRRVQEADLDRADLEDVVVVVLAQVGGGDTGDAPDPLGFRAVDMNRHLLDVEQ